MVKSVRLKVYLVCGFISAALFFALIAYPIAANTVFFEAAKQSGLNPTVVWLETWSAAISVTGLVFVLVSGFGLLLELALYAMDQVQSSE
jgi:hypothetical protein